jgi:DNA-binding FrmR family transcriptional regulator
MDEKIKKNILRRLKITKGQIDGLIRMIESDKYCIDILIQSMAIKNALSSIEDLILENHLKTHVVEQIKNNKEKKAVVELIKIFKLSKRK